MSSIIGKIGLFVAKQAVSIIGPKTVAKAATKQAIKNPDMALKIATTVIKSAIKK